MERANHKKRRDVSNEIKPPSTFSSHLAETTEPQISKLRKRNEAVLCEQYDRESESEDLNWEDDKEYKPQNPCVGGKMYTKVHSFSITDRSCVLADRRMISIRQQSDLLKSTLQNKISASPSTIYRKQE